MILKLQALWKSFENIQMDESEMVKGFPLRTSKIVTQICNCGDSLPDKEIIEKVLRSLPPKFDHIAVVIEESKDLSKMILYVLIGSFQAHVQRINRAQKQPLEQAFQSKLSMKTKP